MKRHLYLLNIILLAILVQCLFKNSYSSVNEEKHDNSNKTQNHYTMDDFKKMLKYDTHVHINTEDKTMINLAREYNFKLLSITVDAQVLPSIREQIAVREKHFREDPDVVAFSTTISLEGWDRPDWASKVIEQLKIDFNNGANSVKVWKNIGMEARDENGEIIFIDDPKFDPIFSFIKEQGKVLLSHAGEPKNCWLPLDSMTVKNDYNYFKAHPQYHMYLHPEMPSYEEQIEHRNNMLAKNPEIKFVGLHLASLEWSVDEIGGFLDRFPNAMVDLAERISHLQYQSQRNREKVRNFFIKYHDRILYGTDFQQNKNTNPEQLEKYMMETWLNDWKYLNTNHMVSVPQLDEPVQGLLLPKNVIDCIYSINAKKLFPDSWRSEN